jgi:hypothetical protein
VVKQIKLANVKDRKEVMKRLDDLWRIVVKEKVGYRCEYCGQKGKVLNSHHIFSRRHRGTRWDTRNGACLCSGHHQFIAHGEPETFRKFLIDRMGQEAYDLLYVRSHTPSKFSYGDLLMLEYDLQKQLHVLREQR